MDYQVTCNKKSKHDGWGRANLVDSLGNRSWGMIYEVDEAEVLTLDWFEGGYERKKVLVTTVDGREIEVETYISTNTDDTLRASDEYKQKIIVGAREHELPPDYIARLEAL